MNKCQILCVISILVITLSEKMLVTSIHSSYVYRGVNQRFANERSNYFQGDIVSDGILRAGANVNRWGDAVIPYYMHRSINRSGRNAIYEAMQDIQSKTCVRFRRAGRYERNYVWITNFNQGCFSYVGRNGGRQQLNLGPGCWFKTTIVHEFGHAIGFWHEQSRADRDSHISIQWNNIPRSNQTYKIPKKIAIPRKIDDFRKEFQKQSNLNNFGTAYDYRSVMHYSYNAFASDRSRPTIVTKNKFPLRLLGTGDNNGGLTETDALQINKMYNCPTKFYG